MRLLIVESPSKAKTIEKYLDGEFVVAASVGHVRDLPKSNKKAIDIEAGFVPHYEVAKGKEKVIAELKRLAKEADEVYLATDPDREGEAIAWHIADIAKLKKPKRIVFNEITKEAVKEALNHPREIDMNLKTAQEARRVLDRLVGYDLSGLIWKKVRYGLSAGRVQSPALRIIVEREREISAFIPTPFWVISGEFETKKKDRLTLIRDKELLSEEEAEKVFNAAKKADWEITSVEETSASRSPRPPFTTSTLQQAASTRLGFSPSRTMRVAQKLYEAGFITYMRTDSPTLSAFALTAIKEEVGKEFGESLYEARAYKTKSKTAQEAHEAIRPAQLGKKSAGNTEEEKRLYDLIRSRTIASQMKSATIMRTKISAEGKDTGAFSANGSRIIFEGWLLADPRAKGEDVILPETAAGEPLKIIDINNERKETTPPQRYSEAGLIKELEKRGIGRPSTYASILKTLIDREYVTKEGRALKATDTGEVVSSFLEENFAKYISDTFTADMENELDEIANGERDYEKTMKDFYTPFSKEVKAKESTAKLTTLGEAAKEFKCPVCSSGMVIKLGRGGKFLSCDRFPECSGALTMDGKEMPKDVPLGKDPESGKEVFVKTGRFGPYVQLGEKIKGKKDKPKSASIPKEKNPDDITLEEALKYLSLPRELGDHPETGNIIVANNGRFGPYIVHNGDFRSLKEDNVYDITLERALEILKEPKKTRGFKKKAK